jgi:hypothetical protein
MSSSSSLSLSSLLLYNGTIRLLQHEASDLKLAGMIVLSEYIPITELAKIEMVQRMEQDVF